MARGCRDLIDTHHHGPTTTHARSGAVPRAVAFAPPRDLPNRYREANEPLGAWGQVVWGDGARERPEPYAQAFREHYGLHPAPFDNGKYPMGLREAKGLILGKGLTTDCLTCHGGSIAGQSYVGLPNTSVDYQALYEDLAALSGKHRAAAGRPSLAGSLALSRERLRDARVWQIFRDVLLRARHRRGPATNRRV